MLLQHHALYLDLNSKLGISNRFAVTFLEQAQATTLIRKLTSKKRCTENASPILPVYVYLIIFRCFCDITLLCFMGAPPDADCLNVKRYFLEYFVKWLSSVLRSECDTSLHLFDLHVLCFTAMLGITTYTSFRDTGDALCMKMFHLHVNALHTDSEPVIHGIKTAEHSKIYCIWRHKSWCSILAAPNDPWTGTVIPPRGRRMNCVRFAPPPPLQSLITLKCACAVSPGYFHTVKSHSCALATFRISYRIYSA